MNISTLERAVAKEARKKLLSEISDESDLIGFEDRHPLITTAFFYLAGTVFGMYYNFKDYLQKHSLQRG